MNSHYAQYLFERRGLSLIENSVGFLAYRIDGKECFIGEMFVTSDSRGSGQGRLLLTDLCQLAIGQGAEVVTANVYLTDPNATNTIAAAIACGFQVKSAGNNIVLIAKEISRRS